MTDTDDTIRQGTVVSRIDSNFDHALNWAVDYRGDVTLVTVDGGEIECYVFDRQESRNGTGPSIRYMTKDKPERTPLDIDNISEIRFSGKDTAAGKSFERWIERYIEKKMAGETASIECESLEED